MAFDLPLRLRPLHHHLLIRRDGQHLEAKGQRAVAEGDAAVRRASLQGELQLPGQHDRHQLLQRGGRTGGDGDHEGKERVADGRGRQVFVLI